MSSYVKPQNIISAVSHIPPGTGGTPAQKLGWFGSLQTRADVVPAPHAQLQSRPGSSMPSPHVPSLRHGPSQHSSSLLQKSPPYPHSGMYSSLQQYPSQRPLQHSSSDEQASSSYKHCGAPPPPM